MARIIAGACCLAAVCWPLALRAASPAPSDTPLDEPQPFALEDLLVTATRSPAPAFNTPFLTDTLTAEQILRRHYRTLPQALRDVPGVLVQETSPAQGSPFIRGFTGRHNLLLIDGVRLNNSAWRSGPVQYWNTIDPLSVHRIEIVKGPASVLYGSDAVGGTVNVLTASPWTYGPGLRYAARGYYRASSAENSHTGRAQASLSLDETAGLLVGGTARHFGDLLGGHDIARQGGVGYDEWSADFKAEYLLTDNVRLVAAHQAFTQNNAPRTHSTRSAVSFHGTTTGSDRRRDIDEQRELTYLQLHADELGGFIDSFHTSLSWQRASEVTDRITGGGARSREGFDVSTLGYWAQFQSPSPLGRWTYGLEYYRDFVQSFSTASTLQGSVGDDAGYDLLGLYLQDQLQLTDRLALTLGGRFSYAAAHAHSVQDPALPTGTGPALSIEDHWTAAVGSARATYALLPEKLNAFAGVSQGFRAPNLDDLTSLQIARSGELAIPSPGLEPEHYLAYEVGLKARHAGFSAEIAYFYTHIQDAIVSSPTGDIAPGGELIVTRLNAGQGFIHGVELAAAYRFLDQFTLFGNLAYHDSQIDTFPTAGSATRGQEYTSRVLPLSGQLGLRWEEPAHQRLWTELQLVMSDAADRLSSADKRDTQRIPPGGTPGYAVLHWRAGWKLTDQLQLTLAVENITDLDYRVHGSGANSPGRNVIFSVDIRF